VVKGGFYIIEGNEALILSNSSALKQRNYEVLTASTLAQARVQLTEGAPDIILLDADLPDGDGLLFCKEIREKTAATTILLRRCVRRNCLPGWMPPCGGAGWTACLRR